VTCRFAFDDGAYVLGALSPAERAEFEDHLPTCVSCRKAVAELAVLPGLLGRLDAETALPQVTAPATLLPRLLVATSARRRRERRRQRRSVLGAVLVAACLAAFAGIGVHVMDQARTRVPSAAMSAMVPASGHAEPVTAEVGLVGTSSGTRVEMRCRYTADGEDGRWTIRLVVFPRWGGLGEQIGTWMAYPGQEVSVTALTHLNPEDIGRVELHRANDTTLLVWNRT
jgi:hypothetical protein